MPLPYKFRAGETAASAEINANFIHLESLIGALSNEEEIAPEKKLKFGSAGYVTGEVTKSIIADSRTPNAQRGFMHLTWNLTPNATTGRWQRVSTNSGSAILQLGDRGVVVAVTNRRTGDVVSQLTPQFGVMSQGNDDEMDVPHIYMGKDIPIFTSYTNPNNPNNDDKWKAEGLHQDYFRSLQRRRLTYVHFDEPKTIMEDKKVDKGTQHINLLSHGVPKNAAMVEVLVYCTATYSSGAGLFLMPNVEKPHRKYGLICHAYGGATAGWGRSAVQGKIALHKGKDPKQDEKKDTKDTTTTTTTKDENTVLLSGILALEATAAFSEVSIYIQGYYV